MNQNKTKENDDDVDAFLNSVKDELKHHDCRELVKIMSSVTGKKAKMWGTSIVGFGSYHYRYESGREGDSFLVGFSPRKQNISIYIMPGFSPYGSLMEKLGKHKTGKSCLYVKNLDAIDRDVLHQLVAESVADMKKKYDCK